MTYSRRGRTVGLSTKDGREAHAMEQLVTLVAQTWPVAWVVPVAAGLVAAGFWLDRRDHPLHRAG